MRLSPRTRNIVAKRQPRKNQEDNPGALRIHVFTHTTLKPMKISTLLPRLAFGIFSAFAAHAATYYVSPDGNDSANGTSPETAWRTVAKVNNTTFAAGDQILFEGGREFSGTSLTPRNGVNGTAASPVVFSSYGEGRATIRITSTTGHGADVTSRNYVHLKNLIFQGPWTTDMASTSSSQYGIKLKVTDLTVFA